VTPTQPQGNPKCKVATRALPDQDTPLDATLGFMRKLFSAS